MRRQLLRLGCSLVGMAFLSGLAACSSNNKSHADSGGQPDSMTPHTDVGQNCMGDPNFTYVLIDDMESTTHGPIDIDAGVADAGVRLSPGYWYNAGASYSADGGVSDMSTPPQGSFVFSELLTPTQTLNCKASTHAAHQHCVLNGLYDICGVGFEFAQENDPDAGATASGDAGANDAGDAGPPKLTVPFDISRYKAITFWGMTTTPDPDKGSLQVKVQLPDTDTDPRGEVCNGGGGNTSQCYNSYGQNLKFTTSWQQFTVLLSPSTISAPVDGGIALDPSFGYQGAQWIPTQVYGINWQAQKNTPPDPDAGPPLSTDIWIDDVYFME